MTSEELTLVSRGEALPLAYALTARVAADARVRLLAIKGMVLAHHQLREPRLSADVDVLVHPRDVEAFVSAMLALGWARVPSATSPSLRRPHAVNLCHAHWPLGIDVHLHFPGFLAPDAEVFEELWRRRTRLALAHQPVWATDATSSAAIAGLHHLRNANSPRDAVALEALVAKARKRFADADLDDLSTLATATGASRSLAPLLERLGAPPAAPHPAEADELESWLLASTADGATVWTLVWRRTPWRQRPAFILQALLPDGQRLRELYFHDRTTPLWRLRVRRVQHVAVKLPPVLRQLLGR